MYLILSSEFPPHSGGIGTCAYKLSKNILDQSIVLSAASRSDSKNRLDKDGVDIIRSSGRGVFNRFLFFVFNIFFMIKKYNINKVIIFDHRSFVFFSIADFFLFNKKRSVYYYGHGSEFVKTDFASSLFRFFLRKSDATILCNSRYTKGLITSTIRKDSYVVLLGGEMFKTSRVEKTDELNYIHKKYQKYNKVVLTVGRVDNRKGQDMIINLINDNLDDFRDILFVLAGPVNKKFWSRLKSQVPESVLVLNEVDLTTLEFIYSNSDFYLQPSRFDSDNGEVEGFGIAVCDAIHSGLIPIVSSHGGMSEVLGGGLEQFVFEENNLESLAQFLRSTINLQQGEVEEYRQLLSRRASELSWENSRYKFERILRL